MKKSTIGFFNSNLLLYYANIKMLDHYLIFFGINFKNWNFFHKYIDSLPILMLFTEGLSQTHKSTKNRQLLFHLLQFKRLTWITHQYKRWKNHWTLICSASIIAFKAASLGNLRYLETKSCSFCIFCSILRGSFNWSDSVWPICR